MNPAPASTSDLKAFRKAYLEKLGADMDRQRAVVAAAAYNDGDPEAVTARYRIHFKPAFAHSDDYEELMARMHAAFTSQGAAGIVKAQTVEDRLLRDTWPTSRNILPGRFRKLSS
jgi:hypothetical protein